MVLQDNQKLLLCNQIKHILEKKLTSVMMLLLYQSIVVDADSIYNQACVQVDKMLSGAAAALSRSASELAALRDNLLTQGGNPQER